MTKNFFRQSILFLFFFLLLNFNFNYSIANSKIYLDLADLVFEHNKNYKVHKTTSQLLLKTQLDKKIENWAKKKFVLKGKHGKLKIKIMEEKIFDNYVTEYSEKFSFIPRDGISYKMFFTIIVLAENSNNNVFARIESSVNGDKTFLGSFSINERSKAIDESIQTMIIKIEQNIEDEINKKFKDFLTNKYN